MPGKAIIGARRRLIDIGTHRSGYLVSLCKRNIIYLQIVLYILLYALQLQKNDGGCDRKISCNAGTVCLSYTRRLAGQTDLCRTCTGITCYLIYHFWVPGVHLSVGEAQAARCVARNGMCSGREEVGPRRIGARLFERLSQINQILRVQRRTRNVSHRCRQEIDELAPRDAETGV